MARRDPGALRARAAWAVVAAVARERRRGGLDGRGSLTRMAIETVNPATGERLKTFPALTAKEIETKLARAWAARLTWRRVPIAERARIVRRAGEILDERK